MNNLLQNEIKKTKKQILEVKKGLLKLLSEASVIQSVFPGKKIPEKWFEQFKQEFASEGMVGVDDELMVGEFLKEPLIDFAKNNPSVFERIGGVDWPEAKLKFEKYSANLIGEKYNLNEEYQIVSVPAKRSIYDEQKLRITVPEISDVMKDLHIGLWSIRDSKNNPVALMILGPVYTRSGKDTPGILGVYDLFGAGNKPISGIALQAVSAAFSLLNLKFVRVDLRGRQIFHASLTLNKNIGILNELMPEKETPYTSFISSATSPGQWGITRFNYAQDLNKDNKLIDGDKAKRLSEQQMSTNQTQTLVPTKEQIIKDMISTIQTYYNGSQLKKYIPFEDVLRMFYQESKMDPNQANGKARGLGQLTPIQAKQSGFVSFKKFWNNPEASAEYAIKTMDDFLMRVVKPNLEKYKGNQNISRYPLIAFLHLAYAYGPANFPINLKTIAGGQTSKIDNEMKLMFDPQKDQALGIKR